MFWAMTSVQPARPVAVPPLPDDPAFATWSAPQQWWHQLPLVRSVRRARLVSASLRQNLAHPPPHAVEIPLLAEPFGSGSSHGIFAGKDGSGLRGALLVWASRLPREAQLVCIGDDFIDDVSGKILAHQGRPVVVSHEYHPFTPINTPQTRVMRVDTWREQPFDPIPHIARIHELLKWWNQQGSSAPLVLVWRKCPPRVWRSIIEDQQLVAPASNIHCWIMDDDFNVLCDEVPDTFWNVVTITAVFGQYRAWKPSPAAQRRLEIAFSPLSPDIGELDLQYLARHEALIRVGDRVVTGRVVLTDEERNAGGLGPR